MKLICPDCQSPIDAGDVNVSTDLAKCVSCNQVFKASELAADVDLREGLTPPAGSGVVFSSEQADCGSFSIPKSGLTGSDAFALLFATFWICFIAFWTWGAAHGSILFAAFSIPFWVVGIGMWRGILIGITETQELRLDTDMLTILKKSVVSTKQLQIPYNEIESIDVQSFMPRDPFTMTRHMRHFTRMSGMWGGIPLATIVHGTKKTHIAENVSEAETKWLVKMLKAVLFKQAGKRV
jgi:hypothetical protein